MQAIIITGGAGGIGLHLVNAFLDEGLHVIVFGRSESRYKNSFPHERAKSNLQFIKTDVSSQKEVNNAFVQIMRENYSLIGLINAAGVQSPIGEFENCDLSKWENNLRINILGAATVIQSALPLLKLRKNSSIINFSGGGATSPRPNFSAYAISKTAITRFSEILAIELSKYSINVNAVAPGAINTNMTDEVIDAGIHAGDELKSANLRRSGAGDNPEKIVELCKFLLSSQSAGITGKLISAVWDDFTGKDFKNRLISDPDFCSLRRIDSFNFESKE